MNAPYLREGIAVITGAASGFGLEVTRLAAQRRMRLALVDVQEAALQSLAQQLRADGLQVLAQCVDVSQEDAMQGWADQVFERFGAPHFVFNNAGVATGGLIWEAAPPDWQWVLGVNLMGVVHGVRLFTPMMLAAAKADPRYQGHIVNTASMAGLVNAPNMGVYNVSKHAVVSLSETLYHDLKLVTESVQAHVLCPYFVPTGISQSHRNRPAALRDENQVPTASQAIAQTMSDKAVSSGKVSAAQVAQQVFDALEEGRFYIYSHPQALAGVQQRLHDVLEGQRPSDPFAHRPELGQRLREALR